MIRSSLGGGCVIFSWPIIEDRRTRRLVGRVARLLPYREFRIAGELIGGHGKILVCRTLADAARRIIDRTVTGAKVAARVGAVVFKRHATKMRANADDDEPFRLLHPGLIARWIAQFAQ